jgi:hypothetical protein
LEALPVHVAADTPAARLKQVRMLMPAKSHSK